MVQFSKYLRLVHKIHTMINCVIVANECGDGENTNENENENEMSHQVYLIVSIITKNKNILKGW